MSQNNQDGTDLRLPIGLAAALLPVLIWSWIAPHERLTWWMEALPVLIAVPLLALTIQRFPLTPLLYCLIWVHCVILLVGAHYAYALVPIGDWARDSLGLSRNPYDRLGHLVQGLVPALVARELLIRLTPLRPGAWLFSIVTLSTLGISAGYELIEWLSVEILDGDAESFLGQQGDVWDAQKDMAIALFGAIIGQFLFARHQDRAIKIL
jgi:putative membrane protein